ncbi:MAG: MFS transporter [Candidatus Odinarchaeota archaeon]
MSFSDQLKAMLTRKGLVLISGPLLGSLIWIFHFILEFSVIEAAGLPPIAVLFHLGAIIPGVLFLLFWSSKRDQSIYYTFFFILFGLSLIGLVITRDKIITCFLLALAGFSIGNTVPLIYFSMRSFFTRPEFNGRINYIAYTNLSLFLIIAAVIDYLAFFSGATLLYALFLGIILLIVFITFFAGRDETTLPSRIQPLKLYLRKGIFPYPVALLAFFIGFFYTNAYYAAVILLDSSQELSQSFPYPSSLNVFVLVLALTSLITSMPSGFLYDKIGRRWSILVGFYIVAFAFFLVAVLRPVINDEFLLLFIFPVLTSTGITLALYGGFMVMYIELSPKEHLIAQGGVMFLFFGIGINAGVIIDVLLEALIEEQLFLLPIMMIFAYFTATIVVFQLREPLPSKAEIEWRRKIEHVLVLSRSGLPLYSEPLQTRELAADAILAGGAIIGISTLSSEITRASHLKVIKHENYCIMLEEGAHVILAVMVTEELKTVRDRMLDFIADFESFFEDFLADWTGDTRVFAPAKKLVEKHFA